MTEIGLGGGKGSTLATADYHQFPSRSVADKGHTISRPQAKVAPNEMQNRERRTILPDSVPHAKQAVLDYVSVLVGSVKLGQIAQSAGPTCVVALASRKFSIFLV